MDKSNIVSSLTFLRNIALILTHVVFALSSFPNSCTSGQVKQGITTRNSQLTFLRNIALILTHVQVCQIPLTRPTNEFPDRWPEAGVHQGMNAIVDWVNNEWNSCIATQRLQSANVNYLLSQKLEAIVDWVSNARNCCTAAQRLQSANVKISDNKRNQMLSSS